MRRVTSRTLNVPTTTELVARAPRFDGATSFFRRFAAGWANVQKEVWKLETRQTYDEPESTSWQLWKNGDKSASLARLAVERQVDVPLYRALALKGVEFRRLRPVRYPLTSYLQWEIEAYHFNASHGERIFFVQFERAQQILEEHAKHDFVVFDKELALVHDYDNNGLIRGGWEVREPDRVESLRKLFAALFALAEPYRKFLLEHNQ